MAALNPIRGPIERLGFNVSGSTTGPLRPHAHRPVTAATGGSGGFAGPLEDVLLDVRLIDWDKELATLPVLGQYGTSGTYGGPPDLKIVAPHLPDVGALGDKIRLAAFEAAIVESGIHNLNYGHADWHGGFQQQWSVGEWGTKEQTMDPSTRPTCS